MTDEIETSVRLSEEVAREVARIREAQRPSEGDKEDLITYAREVVNLRRRPAPTGMVDQGTRDELISRARWKARHVPSPVVSALLVELADALTAAGPDVPEGVRVTGKYGDILTPFVAMMESELNANCGKGDRTDWLAMSRETIILEIHHHLTKLQKAALNDDASGIREFGADVANMAMMLVDVCGQLASPPPAAPKPSAGPSGNGGGDTVSGSVYASAVKGRADFRSAFAATRPVMMAAAALRDKWRTPGQKVDSDDFFAAISAVCEAADAYDRLRAAPPPTASRNGGEK